VDCCIHQLSLVVSCVGFGAAGGLNRLVSARPKLISATVHSQLRKK